jgi:hypothetical protein
MGLNMKIFLMVALFLGANFVQANGKQLIVHDQILLRDSSTIVRATVISETILRDVEIVPGKALGMAVNSLKIPQITLRPVEMGGVEVLGATIDSSMLVADLPSQSSYETNFSFNISLGTKWLDSLSKRNYASALIYFYNNEAGGTIPTYIPNMRCELVLTSP